MTAARPMRTAPVGAGVYHRPSRDWLLVTAVHRDELGAVCGYTLADTGRGTLHPQVPVDQVDLDRTEVPGATVIWRDLQPGMTICWSEPPWQLDVIAVSNPDPDGGCVIDAVQGRFPTVAANLFTEVTGELADLAAAIVLDESERLR
jgi:hypothetical protein